MLTFALSVSWFAAIVVSALALDFTFNYFWEK